MRDKGENIFTKNYIIVLLALLSCLLWGSAFPSIKIGYKLFSIGADDTFAKIIFAGFRFFLSSMMIFLFCLGTKGTCFHSRRLWIASIFSIYICSSIFHVDNFA
jgi:drug/metabolite transporter (DMT)-like permease